MSEERTDAGRHQPRILEGLPDPVQYASQLERLDEATVRKIMRDNLANFLGIGTVDQLT